MYKLKVEYTDNKWTTINLKIVSPDNVQKRGKNGQANEVDTGYTENNFSNLQQAS